MIRSTFPTGYGHHQFLIKYHIFCQKSWEVIKTLKVSFGKCDMSINSRFEISARNRQKLPEIWRRGRFLEGFPYKMDHLFQFRHFEFCVIFADSKIFPQLHGPAAQCCRWNKNLGHGTNE